MALLPTALIAVGAVHLAAGLPALLAPEFVCSRLPQRYAEAVGDRREWRGFGAGVTSVGISLVTIGYGLPALLNG
ncbi:hypothetical protein [Halobacterium jilantaiense]|uniref:Uncharacterized protein n=1 Tax=Halobacterium jilantaiense TaxID=355548 RepID=A0A1I0MN27_9EURY|nr:hypothetical protein [Halobacterium jilantaiense]SEV89904.1 hypothetical protein SAMN04487945_0226 [Halobacterium jilantaiense]